MVGQGVFDFGVSIGVFWVGSLSLSSVSCKGRTVTLSRLYHFGVFGSRSKDKIVIYANLQQKFHNHYFELTHSGNQELEISW